MKREYPRTPFFLFIKSKVSFQIIIHKICSAFTNVEALIKLYEYLVFACTFGVLCSTEIQFSTITRNAARSDKQILIFYLQNIFKLNNIYTLLYILSFQ